MINIKTEKAELNEHSDGVRCATLFAFSGVTSTSPNLADQMLVICHIGCFVVNTRRPLEAFPAWRHLEYFHCFLLTMS